MAQPAKKKNLVFDVGMYKGEDTEYYLRKGFDVVSFEALPDLIADCKKKFADEIKSGQLTIVEGAIVEDADKKNEKTVRFYKNIDCAIWSTALTDRAMNTEKFGTKNEIIEVQAIDFAACLRKYGIPHFLKIDIEGMDMACVRALKQFDEKPDYLSMESDKLAYANVQEELALLKSLGYTQFLAVNQESIKHQQEPKNAKEGRYSGNELLAGSSGLFGAELPYRWKNYHEILSKYKHIFFGYDMIGDHGKLRKFFLGKVIAKSIKILSGKRIPGWYDTHAKHASAS